MCAVTFCYATGMRNKLNYLIILFVAVYLIFRFSGWMDEDRNRGRLEDGIGQKTTQDEIKLPGGPFTLIDHRRQIVSTPDYSGSFMLIFFGYTNCPDICPTGLNDIAQTMEKLGPLAKFLEPLFITIDPERDDPAALADYVQRFHPRIIGLTGSPKQIRNVANAYQIRYAKSFSDNAEANHPSDYTMDHSALYFLMGPDGGFVDMFGHGTSPDKMAAKIQKYIELERKK